MTYSTSAAKVIVVLPYQPVERCVFGTAAFIMRLASSCFAQRFARMPLYYLLEVCRLQCA